MLDHLTRGRGMPGVGPGSLPTDSAVIGLNPTDTRELLAVNLDIITALGSRSGTIRSARRRTTGVVEERAAHYRDVEFGIAPWFDDVQEIAAPASEA